MSKNTSCILRRRKKNLEGLPVDDDIRSNVSINVFSDKMHNCLVEYFFKGCVKQMKCKAH